MPDVLKSTTEVGLNLNPELRRDLFRDRLTKTQLHRGTFYKFLLQAGIPFTPMQYVTLTTTLNVDRLLSKNVRKYSTPTTQEMNNLKKLSVVCRLDDVFIDDKEVYVEIRYKNYQEMSNGERNRLLATINSVNLVTFFHDDFEQVGLKLDQDQKYIKTLNKTLLKKWADLLFKKIRSIRGEYIEIPYSLVDVKANIDDNSIDDGNVVKKLKKQNKNLRSRLLKDHVSKNFSLNKEHNKIVSRLLDEHSESLKWINEVMHDITDSCIFSIDLRKNKFKDVFTQTNGKVNAMNKDLLRSFVENHLNDKRSIYAYPVDDSILQVCNEKTLQSFHLMLVPTVSDSPKSVSLPKDRAKDFPDLPVFTLVVHYDKLQRYSKPVKVTGEVIIPKNFNKKYTYTKNYRLTVFESDRDNAVYVDWAV